MIRVEWVFLALALPQAGLAAPLAGEARLDRHGVAQVYVPAGCFEMGTTEAAADAARALPDAPDWALARLPSEQPAHETCLTQGYWIDKTEVTNAMFDAFIAAGGYETPEYWSADGARWLASQYRPILPYPCDGNNAPDQPRMCITFYEAEAYAAWRGGALPTEAQWEFAARGPDSLIYPWGNDWDATRAHILGATAASPVGAYPQGASWVGALDMSGNAMEWVADWLGEDYFTAAPQDDPTGPDEGSRKVEKGGWWGSNPVAGRAAYRHFEDPPRYQDHHVGFRIVTAE